MKYARYLGEVAVVSTDSKGNPKYYEDSEGGITYLTDGTREIYEEPKDFDANFATSGGEAQEAEYGLDISQYDGIAIYGKNAYPIEPSTIIWTDSEVEFDGEKTYYTEDMHTLIEVHAPVKQSADYVCKKTDNSLNYSKAIFTAINK